MTDQHTEQAVDLVEDLTEIAINPAMLTDNDQLERAMLFLAEQALTARANGNAAAEVQFLNTVEELARSWELLDRG